MANHVTTRVLVIGPKESLEKFFDETMSIDTNGDTKFDFRKVIPQPPEVRESIETNEGGPDGLPLWWTWDIANWGTKWNNYGNPSDKSEIRQCAGASGDVFEFTMTLMTAWSWPDKVIASCADRFRDLGFISKYADEDIGYNCGSSSSAWSNEANSVVTVAQNREGDEKFSCSVIGRSYEEWKKEQEEDL